MSPRGPDPKSRRTTQILSVPLPEYQIGRTPDYRLGERVDQIIRDHFDVDRIIVRAVSSMDHRPLTLDELTEVVAEEGWDRTEPSRREVAHEQFEPYHADFHGGPFRIEEDETSFFGGVMRHFYQDARTDRGYPLRIDLLLIYDRARLLPADTPDAGKPRVRPRLETFLFRFKNPDRKKDALIGLVKIL